MKANRILRLLMFGFLPLSGQQACGDSDSDSGAVAKGGESQPCYPNGTCNGGLSCLSKVCVKAPQSDGAGGAPPDSSAGSGGKGGTDAGAGAAGSGAADTGATTGGAAGVGGIDGSAGVGGSAGWSCADPVGTLPTLALKPVASGLTSPVQLSAPPGRPDTLFIVEQGGTIRIHEGGQLVATPFLDVSNVIRSSSEEGLLGLAFHPNYAQNGRFFIHYSAVADGASTVMEYARSAGNPNLANPTPVQLVVQVPTAQPNNNGGALAFASDGFLYVSLGDGGAQHDPGCDAQNPQSLLGKILRLDVGLPADANGYPAAAGNPSGAKQYHIGLRNPWRISFDSCTADLYIGDAGQDAWEEVDVAPRASSALNFGWPMREGMHDHANDCPSPPSNLAEPIAEVADLNGVCAMIGGHVYRGSAIPALRGAYFFGDFCSGSIYTLRYRNGTLVAGATKEAFTGGSISAFGQDGNGEIYVVALTGEVHRIAAQ